MEDTRLILASRQDPAACRGSMRRPGTGLARAPPAVGLAVTTGRGRMSRIRLVLVVAVGAALVGALAGSSHWRGTQRAAAPPFSPSGEQREHLGMLDAYWNDRLTYPTGRFNPAWLRKAARQDSRIASRAPAGPDGGTSWVALGPKPERMDGCNGCYNYHYTQGRINAIVVDPTTTTDGSIVAYAGSVGGGVWKTTNCCNPFGGANATTWTT